MIRNMKSLWQKTLWLLLLLVAGAQTMRAENKEFEYEHNFTVYETGTGAIHFRLLLWAEASYNHWACSQDGKISTISIVPEGQTNAIPVVTYYSDNDRNKHDDYGWGHVNTLVGEVKVTNSYGEGVISIPQNTGRDFKVKETHDNKFVEFDWYPPQQYMSKSMSVKLFVYERRVVGGSTYSHNYPKANTWSFNLSYAYQPLIVSDAVFYPLSEGKDAGKIAIPYASPYAPDYYYTNLDSKHVNTTEPGGMIYVNSSDTVTHTFQVFMHALRKADPDPSKNMYWDLTSNVVRILAYHKLYDFKVEDAVDTVGVYKDMSRGHKRLTWRVEHADQQDIMAGDAFEIQRAYTPDFSDAQDVGTVPYRLLLKDYDKDEEFEDRSLTYEYIDSMPEAYANQLDPEQPIYYRVRRCSSQTWGWDHKWAGRDSIVAPVYLTAPSHNHKVIIEKDKDYKQNRKVKLMIPMDGECYPARIEHTMANGSKEYTIVSRPLFWNETAQLVLIQHTHDRITHKILTSTEYTIPQNAIIYNRLSKRWEATYTDVVAVPCVEYSYEARVVTDKYTTLLPIDKDVENHIIATSIPGSVRDYVLPMTGTPAIPNYETLPISTDELGKLYFDDVEAPSDVEASDNTFNDHVLVKWKMASGACDHFRITKRWKEDGKDMTEVIDNLTDTYYEDYNVKGGEWYEYTVYSVLNCHKLSEKYADPVKGRSNRTALIAGKVQYTNGMAISGILVKAVMADNAKDAESSKNFVEAVTDENGTYRIIIPERPYTSKNFYVMAVDSKGYQFNNGTPDGKYCQVSIGDDHINNEGYNLYSSEYVVMKGQVCYAGTSIPVPGVSFLLNTDPHNAKKDVLVKNIQGTVIKTDTEGNYALTLPKGMDFSIQATKEGHRFNHNGFVEVKNSKVLNFKEDMYEVDIWDSTTVRLIGRIAGGNDQHSKVLGMGKSVNNLGDDLQFVLALEGDDVSHFVFDRHDLTKKQRDTTFTHYIDTLKTQVHFDTKRITVRPDQLTGEYIVDLPPVKYKVTQATAKGYATLFAKDMGAAVVDLTDKLEVKSIDTGNKQKPILYNDTYSINYHSPVNITYQQTNYGQPKPYYGDETVELSNFASEDCTVPAVMVDGDKVEYTFGYPIFNGITPSAKVKNKYTFSVTAHEDYYYNNDKVYGRHDQVMMHGGKVKVSNGLDVSPDKDMEYVLLDTLGKGTAYVTVCNPTFTLTGEDALRTLSFSMDVNGEQVLSNPLRAFVTGVKQKGSDIVGRDIDVLDVLRDPPGSASYAWLEAGTTYSSTYTVDFSANYGGEIDLTLGKSITNITGTVGGAALLATQSSNGSVQTLPIRFVTSVKSKNTYNYTYTTSKRIQTSASDKFVGNMGNIFIGTERSMRLDRYSVIAAISDETRVRLAAAEKEGDIKILASGKDAAGKKVHLAISDQINFSVIPETEFAYTQKHILKNLIPELTATRNSLLQIGTHDEIQALANAKGEVMYRSKTDTLTSPNFGTEYEIIYPNHGTYKELKVDTIAALNSTITKWVNAIAMNERLELESLFFPEKATNIAVSSGSSQQYSESISNSWAYNTPVNNSMAKNGGIQLGTKLASTLVSMFNFGSGFFNGGYKPISQGKPDVSIEDLIYAYFVDEAKKNEKKDDVKEFNIAGVSMKIKVVPVVEITKTETGDISQKSSRTVGFKIEEGNGGHLNVGVYRTRKRLSSDEKFNQVNLSNLKGGDKDINSLAINNGIDKNLATDQGVDVNLSSDDYQAADFVYFINGGATRCPYEPAEHTYFYHPNTALGRSTLKIDDPKIVVNNPVVGNVPTDQPAVFDIILSNETESPKADGALLDMTMNLAVLQETNPNGAKFMMDGVAFSDGLSLVIPRGQAVHKKLEVYRGTVDDYENLKMKFYTDCDVNNGMITSISAHFQPTSTDIVLSTPTDKWVMNTLSPQDSIGYYLPIKIEGFDVNYRNFDHIELQYKKSTQPDEDYVNLRSYYADSTLYAQASGAKGMITSGVIDDIVFYGGNKIMEQNYDLRAVSFCRLGNSFVTKSSKVLSGLKDTRRPQLFGSVTPKDGILGIGDYISIPFSENIAGNILSSKNNFQILGYTNKTGIINSTSLSFDGNKGNEAKTEVKRSLADSDFSIDMMIDVDDVKASQHDMVLFSQGDANNSIEFGRTKDGKLYLGMMNHLIYNKVLSKEIPKSTSWQRVAVSYNHEDGEVKFYVGSQQQPVEGDAHLPAKYNGASSELHFGNSLDGANPYCGNMLETRLWMSQMDLEMLEQYDHVTLTGYERGLLAYYPMNEGRGQQISDKANGAHIIMGGQTWTLPSGISLNFDGKHGVQLKEKYFQRTESNNYTLGMWFKAEQSQQTDTVAIYAEGRGHKGDQGLFIGLEKKNLAVRQNGYVAKAKGNYQDGNWHHLALSVDRLHNVANLHIDGVVATQFPADSLGALGVKKVWLGQCNWTEPTGEKTYVTHKDDLRLNGHIDDLTLWSQALPESYVNGFYNNAPTGGEMGLMVNLPFSKGWTNDNNVWECIYSGHNNIVKTEQTAAFADSLIVVTPAAVAESMSDAQTIAPVRESDILTNMGFSWVSKDNELVINLDMPDRTINKQNVLISVRDVEDLAGNPMADPLTWTVFVDRNALKWGSKYVNREIEYNKEDEFSVDVRNLTGTTMYYQVEDLPEWLEVDYPMGSAAPTAEFPLKFRVKNTLDPGQHSSLVYLTDQNGLSEPLVVTVDVEAKEPEWNINEYAYSEQMSVIGKVIVKERNASGQIIEYEDVDERDIVSAFMGSFCVGKAHISKQNGKNAFYMTVYGVNDRRGVPLDFQLWRASTGNISILEIEGDKTVDFVPDTLAGSPAKPVVLRTGIHAVQQLDLQQGWNWVSFNIKPRYDSTKGFTSAFLGDYQFTVNDIIKSDGLNATYGARGWVNFGKQGLNHCHSYMMRIKTPGTLSVVGTELDNEDDRTIVLKQGWNYLPYFSNRIHTLNEALTDYTQQAQPGDIVKGYSEFAVMDEDRHWVGSLTHLRPGVGYMLKRNAENEVKFIYPMMLSSIGGADDKDDDEDDTAEAKEQKALAREVLRQSHNMPVLAIAIGEDGEQAREGDIICAYQGNELVGVAEADRDGRFYLMTSAEEGSELSFVLISGGETADDVKHLASSKLKYDSQAAIGTTAVPYVIEFNSTATDAEDAVYDMNGRKMPSRKLNRGIYITRDKNGEYQKEVIK